MAADPLADSPRRCLVVGSPIAHSLSPALHRAAYAALGLTWTYDAHEVRAGELRAFVHARASTVRGVSVTMPLKQEALVLGVPSEVAMLTGAANTLVFDDDETRADNTDVPGLAAALGAAGVSDVATVVVLGTGATARSSLVAVQQLGATTVTVLGRRPEAVDALAEFAESLGLQATGSDLAGAIPKADLAVSSVPAAVSAGVADTLAAACTAIFDVVYDPWPTPLAAAGQRRGRTTLNGLDLLVHQAVEQVRLMTGYGVDAAVLAAAGREELRRRGRA